MAVPRLYRGMRDFLPDKMIVREKLLKIIRKIFQSWGYIPIETPAIELLETLLGKSGTEADKLIYRIEHADGLGLRYELTISLARFVSMHWDSLPKPFRRYQIQPVWRAERAQKQKGRFREFIQCDVDIIGSNSPLTDAEILAISMQCLDRLGFTDYKLLLNHRNILLGLVKIAGLKTDDEASVLRSIDKWDKIGKDGVRDELLKKGYSEKNVSKLIEFVDLTGDNSTLLAELDLLDDKQIKSGTKNLREIMKNVNSMGVSSEKIVISPKMARGLDYYTGAIFETVLPELPQMGSLTGGGRFGNLIGIFLGREIPACGTTIGLDRILAAMKELKLLEIDNTYTKVLVVMFSEELANKAVAIAGKFREAGIATELFIEPKKLSKQFEYANKMNIPFVALIGEDEAKSGKCVLKNMNIGEQWTLSWDDAVSKVVKEVNEIE